MDPIVAKLAEAVVRALARAAGALIGEKAKSWLKDRNEREAYERALAKALEDVGKQFPAISASFFDEHFLHGPVAEELAIFFFRHRAPDPSRIAEAYAKQFSASHVDALNAAELFLARAEEHMKEEVPLQELLNRRQIERASQILERLDQRLGVGGVQATPVPSAAPATRDAETRPAIESAFRSASGEVLEWPQTLDDGQWIPRAELELLEATISSSDRSAVMLLGAPGSGKSALMARLARQSTDAGCAVLAIKADQLPEDIRSLRDMEQWLGLDLPLIPALELVAAQQKTVLLIDQLDALSELIDLRTGRLSALVILIRRAAEIPNLHIICSCRSFERRYDARLSRIDAEEVQLAPLPWPTVLEILRSRGLNADAWPEEFRDMLCYPQCLKLFLRFFSGASEAAVFKTYQAMLEHLWRERLFKSAQHAQAAVVLNRIATDMAERETLHAPVARFEAERRDLDYLVSVGILQYDETLGQISFTHQTLFDFARARAFVTQEGSLSRFVLARQTALFVRPKLWSGLAYLRATDASAYRSEFLTLWNEAGLRPHLRLLLIDFAGMQEVPQPFEIQALRTMLDDPRYLSKTLNAIAGRNAWFDEVKGEVLPRLMEADVKDGWPARWVLQRAWPFARNDVLYLLKKFWLTDQSKREQAFLVLQELGQWDDATLRLAVRIIEAGGIHDPAVSYLASVVSAAEPALAIKLAAAQIGLRLKEAMNAPPPPLEIPEGASEEEKEVARALHEPRKALKDLLDRSDTSWYDLPAVVEASPTTWLDEMWPLLREALELIADPEPRIVHEYRDDSFLATNFEDDAEGEARREYPILGATLTAVRELAKHDPDRFIAFVRNNENSEVASVHRLLAIGLSQIGATHARFGLEYLLGDARRLQLENFYEDERETKMLIRAITPHLSAEECGRLETVILSASTTRPDFREEDAETRFKRQKWDRQFRLRLLQQFPREKLSGAARELMRTELESAFPGFEDKRREFEMVASSSRMSADQMARASDEAVLNFVKEYPDSIGWGNVFDRRGGSIEVSRAFGEFAKNSPARALRICERMDPTTHQRPLGYAIDAIDEKALPLDELAKVVFAFDAKGFQSHEFRAPAASSLRKRVNYPDGLPDAVIDLLVRWLEEYKIEEEEQSQSSDEEKPREESVLWGYGGFMILPHGTYPILSAILIGLIGRDPVPNHRLFGILTQLLERNDSIRVWEAIGMDLSRYLPRCSASHIETFIDALFAKYPVLIGKKTGIWLVAHALRLVSASAAQRWLVAIRDHGSDGSMQAFGELLILYALLAPAEIWPRSQIEHLLKEAGAGDAASQSASAGLVHGAVHLWKDIEDKAFLGRILAAGMLSDHPATGKAALDWFRVNEHARLSTRNRPIFAALAEGKAIGAVRSYTYLVEALMEVLQDDPQLVYAICLRILESVGSDIGNMANAVAMDAEGIINIALTLQRMEEPHRTNGLILFERLIELNAYRAREALMDVDRRPGAALSSCRRRGRRKRAKQPT